MSHAVMWAGRQGEPASESRRPPTIRAARSSAGRVKAAEITPAISAVMVMLNIELGYAPEMMRGMLASPKGAEMLQQGLRELGMHLVRQLVK